MELLLDARKLEHTGIGRVTRELVRELAEMGEALPGRLGVLTLPAGQGTDWGGAAVRTVNARPFSLAEGVRLRRALAALQPEVRLYHAPHIHLPPLKDARPARVVVTVHDTIPLASPDYGPLKRAAYRRMLRGALAQADAVVVPSAATEAALRRLAHAPLPPVHVIAPPLARAFREVAPLPEVPAAAPLVAFASPRWHKNTVLLLDAFEADPNHVAPLHLVGTTLDLAKPQRRWLATLQARHGPAALRLLGRLDDATLRETYRSALALLWPSHFEGFGLPVWEALACGCPVLAGPASCTLVEHTRVLPLGKPQAWAEAVSELRREQRIRTEVRRAAAEAALPAPVQSAVAHIDLYLAHWPSYTA